MKMKVIMGPEFEKQEALAKVVREATPLLEDLLGKSAARVTVKWDIPRSGYVRVAVSDELGKVNEAWRELPFNTLTSKVIIRETVYRLWRNFLDEAFEKNLEYLKANVPTE
jgi:hypothetical protein